MFKEAIIYYPSDTQALARIYKELAVFYCSAAIKYVGLLNLNNRQIEALCASLEEEIATKKQPA